MNRSGRTTGSGSFTVERYMAAPVGQVWEALADIGSIHVWNPGVTYSYATGEEAIGLGASRHCDLGRLGYLKEKVVEFDTEARLTMRVVDTNLPFARADIRFHLKCHDGGTTVTVEPVYRLRYGLLGAVIDRFFVRRTYRRGMGALLDGLRDHVEGPA